MHPPRRGRGVRLALVVCAWVAVARGAPSIDDASHGAVATGHSLATVAAMTALRDGGNAIDAAVAAALTLGVVDGHNSGLGGGCFLLARLADGRVVAIDGREQAPAAATREMFVVAGRARTDLSQTGALAIGVPGALAAYEYALTNYGKRPLAGHLHRAARVAEKGFQVNRSYAARLAVEAEALRRFDASRALFFHADGAPYQRGERLSLLDLAASYRAIAADGTRWFYGGPFARAVETWMTAQGGRVTSKDFQVYRLKLREPVRTTYRQYEVIGFPPPSSGGVLVAQMLNVLEHFDLKTLGANSPQFVHVVTEVMKLAFADRAHWLGDPDFAPVPRGLVSRDYAASLAKRIDPQRARPVVGPGRPPEAGRDLFGQHTTHFSVADAEGNWVACTATLNTSFGSKVVIPGTGLVLNNQMDDFAIQPGVTNYFGLVGGEANAVAPGKRPLSSMSPTIVCRDGRPVLAIGAAGGPTIISQTLLAIVHFIDFGWPPERALAQARFHHQWQPDELVVEQKLPEPVRRELEQRGHRLKIVAALGAAQAVSFDPKNQRWLSAADPRGEGTAAQW